MKFLTLIVIVLLAIGVGNANATNLRGQVVRNSGGHYVPLANTRVDLMYWNGSTWVSTSYAVTGADGFYYFNNLPPNTRFCILVLGHLYPSSQGSVIGSVAPPGYQDMPVIST